MSTTFGEKNKVKRENRLYLSFSLCLDGLYTADTEDPVAVRVGHKDVGEKQLQSGKNPCPTDP